MLPGSGKIFINPLFSYNEKTAGSNHLDASFRQTYLWNTILDRDELIPTILSPSTTNPGMRDCEFSRCSSARRNEGDWWNLPPASSVDRVVYQLWAELDLFRGDWTPRTYLFNEQKAWCEARRQDGARKTWSWRRHLRTLGSVRMALAKTISSQR